MEEKLKRCDRRHRTKMAIKRRLRKYLFFDIIDFGKVGLHRKREYQLTSNAEKYKYFWEGNGFQFLRTTASYCNCWTCSGEHKYRNHRAKEKARVRQEIDNDL